MWNSTAEERYIISASIVALNISNREADPSRPDQPKRKGHGAILLIDPAMVVIESQGQVTLPRRPGDLHFYDVQVQGSKVHKFQVNVRRVKWNLNYLVNYHEDYQEHKKALRRVLRDRARWELYTGHPSYNADTEICELSSIVKDRPPEQQTDAPHIADANARMGDLLQTKDDEVVRAPSHQGAAPCSEQLLTTAEEKKATDEFPMMFGCAPCVLPDTDDKSIDKTIETFTSKVVASIRAGELKAEEERQKAIQNILGGSQSNDSKESNRVLHPIHTS